MEVPLLEVPVVEVYRHCRGHDNFADISRVLGSQPIFSSSHTSLFYSYGRACAMPEYRRGELLLRITDDGCGISPDILEGHKPSCHFGLLGIRERVGHLNGRLRIDSRPGAGARIEVRLPAGLAYHDAFRWPWQRKKLRTRWRRSHPFG